MSIGDIAWMRATGMNNQGACCMEIKDCLEARMQYLERLKEEKLREIQNAPAGSLRIDNHTGKAQYYFRSNRSVRNGKYISRTQEKLIRALAQKEYDERVLKAVNREIVILNSIHRRLKENCAEDIYQLLPGYRQNIVDPIEIPDELFIQDWNSVEFTGKQFSGNGPELITDRGERVRSKSELIIANTLNQESVPYRYEYPIYLQNVGTVYPDFTILNVRLRKEIIWEHQGMMDDPVYAEQAVMKVQSYILNGYYPGEKLLLTSETRKWPLNMKILKNMICRYCK